MIDILIIGAGPYGFSLAAHAKERGLNYKIIGFPMDFWKSTMPQNMYIRTPPSFVQFSEPNGKLTLKRFSKETGAPIDTPLPRETFIHYSEWFIQKTGVEFVTELVTEIKKLEDVFEVKTDHGNSFIAKNVIVATGIGGYKYIPDLFKDLPSHLVSHTSGYTNFTPFKGKDVAVIGSGQSAWEAAALLHQEGAKPELFYRSSNVSYSGSSFAERILKALGNIYYQLPKKAKQALGNSQPTVAHFLCPLVEKKVKETSGVSVKEVSIVHDDQVKMTLSNGDERVVDHIILATGFHFDLEKIPFFSDSMKSMISREEDSHYPRLSANFESSLPGLYFAGTITSYSHGPTFKFILGLDKTANTIIPSIVFNKTGFKACCA